MSDKEKRGIFRNFVMAIGILIMVASGLCSGFLIVANLGSSLRQMKEVLGIVLPCGGIPFAIGLLFYWSARNGK